MWQIMRHVRLLNITIAMFGEKMLSFEINGTSKKEKFLHSVSDKRRLHYLKMVNIMSVNLIQQLKF